MFVDVVDLFFFNHKLFFYYLVGLFIYLLRDDSTRQLQTESLEMWSYLFCFLRQVGKVTEFLTSCPFILQSGSGMGIAHVPPDPFLEAGAVLAVTCRVKAQL